MAKKAAFGAMLSEAPDNNVVPEGLYLVKTIKVTEKHAKNGKLMFGLQAQILEPKALKGQMIFENFVLGTDDDPEAEQPATFKNSRGARDYKKFLKKAGVTIDKTDDKDDIANKAAGQELLVSVRQEEQQDGLYKGQVQNHITAYYEPGEKTPVITGEAPAETKAAPAEPKKAKAKPAPEPEEDDDEDDEDEDDDDEDEDDDE